MRKMRLGSLDAHVFGGSDGEGSGDGPVVVLFHGFGAPGTDLVPLGREVRVAPETRWVFPMAPIELQPGFDDDSTPRAWWLIDMMELQIAVMTRNYAALADRVPEGIDETRAHVDALLAAVQKELGAPTERIVLGGFSQGAMLATDTILRSASRFAGLAIFSGSVINKSAWKARAPGRAGLPTLICHGRADPVLPFSLAEELRDLLVQAKLDVAWLPFDGGHTIPAAALGKFTELVNLAHGPKPQ